MVCASDITCSLLENNNFSIADLHIHGKYAISTSKTAGPGELIEGAIRKGVDLLGSGDCLFPPWADEFREYWGKQVQIKVIPTTEVSVHFNVNGANHAIHFIIILPSIEIAKDVAEKLKPFGNVQTMARPNIFLPVREFCEIISAVHPEICLIPAHIFTPYYSLLGARGLDDLVEIKDLLTACETGLSADPLMCSRIKALNGIALVSFSDAHSPRTIGREATFLDKSLPLKKALMNPALTIECFPQFGKYHATGHAKCGYEAEEGKNERRCKICGKVMPQGVVDRLSSFEQANLKVQPFIAILPLEEIISTALGISRSSKEAKKLLDGSFEKIGPEIFVLTGAKEAELSKAFPDKVVELLLRVRRGDVTIKPGYDGVYGYLEL